MRILLIGPTHRGGSLPPYLDVLTDALRHHGAQVDRLGATGLPYDPVTHRFWPAQRIVATAEALLRSVDLGTYDILSVHFGNLEIEQLLPVLWANRPRPPAVYHVHSLDATLFAQHVPNPRLRAAVDTGIRSMDGYICFGTHGRDRLTQRLGIDAPTAVSWLPTTIPAGTRPSHNAAVLAAMTTDHLQVGTLYGYAAPWKDIPGLIDACTRTTHQSRIVIAGPLWDAPHEAGADLSCEITGGVQHGGTQLRVVVEYLDAPSRAALVDRSDFAVFPYRAQPTFQGSGAVADYLARGVPVIATDVANMAELVSPAGIIVPPGDPEALSGALNQLATDPDLRADLSAHARTRAPRLTAEHHAMQCLELYERVAATRAHQSGVPR